MAFEYVSVDEAIKRPGLRMVVVGTIPSPWGEAAKGILHVKGIDWTAVRVDYEHGTTKKWTGLQSGPVAMYEDEKPRSEWDQILLLAERIAPTPSLLPADAAERALALGLCHEMCAEQGLGWARRLQLIHAGLNDAGGFKKGVAQYLVPKYGYSPEAAAAADRRVRDLLHMLADRLKSQRAAGSDYYMGNGLTAVDIYSAAFSIMFRPLPPEQCEMRASARATFETLDAETEAALDPILFEHRDRIFTKHLELPLSL